MSDDIEIYSNNKKIFPEYSLYEVVERKGIGHPDTLADGIAETVSLNFSRHTLEKFDVILNHWVDKALVTGGLSRVGFGEAKLLKPLQAIIYGKMSTHFENEPLNHKKISEQAIKEYFKFALPRLNVDKWLKIKTETNNYSRNPYWMKPRGVKDIPNFTDPRANDTSLSIGYWPLSTLEKTVLMLERFFYDDNLEPKYKHVGHDIKTLAVRKRKKISITAAVPMIPKYIFSESQYEKIKENLYKDILNFLTTNLKSTYEIYLTINNEDRMTKIEGEKRKGHYFLVTGTALDDGEVGVVGRGNHANGVISIFRPHSMEAPYGKNPVYHVGKVYTYLANILARNISQNLDCRCTVLMSSRMGDKINKPHKIIVQTSSKIDKKKVRNIIKSELSIGKWYQQIIDSKFFVPTPGQNIDPQTKSTL